MKIIALLPFKNESWALPSYLSSISKIADTIIALDDNSSDGSASLLKAAGAILINYDSSHEEIVNMSHRRQVLLDAGRKELGTHFIWLDADETFSANFIPKAREIILALEPGQKISMRWIHIWKDENLYLDDKKSPFGYTWKDIIVADNGSDVFAEKFLSESRTPGTSYNFLQLPEEVGVVIHWQFLHFETNQYKQVLYRCIELVEGSRSPRKINNTYQITLDNKAYITKEVPVEWLESILFPVNETDKISHYKQQIAKLFNKYGIAYFEGLQIWHIPDLQEEFVTKCGRPPKSKTFPGWMIMLITIKNKLRYV